MPYAVKCFPGKDAGVILCKDDRELVQTCAKAVVALEFSFTASINLGLILSLWAASNAPSFFLPPITIYRLTEEEYEKWQKAF